jgi:hypothetical protein
MLHARIALIPWRTGFITGGSVKAFVLCVSNPYALAMPDVF